ncbi:MAG: hypothetical protein C7B46_17080 [Sulfobacillus benefaciens]|uniref:Uncharacterized protein n=1 Tax=Sulfobacillus benefaciens TaxID=453960 RepID=A0A2T2X9R7_9FIRM|nr:MAG: hypothetical protein C7B46_17080 [Sulfobacillus benefaciens]
MAVKISDKLAQGAALPRGDWHGVIPRTQVVPAKNGRKAPYRCRPRRRQGRTVLPSPGTASSGDGDADPAALIYALSKRPPCCNRSSF